MAAAALVAAPKAPSVGGLWSWAIAALYYYREVHNTGGLMGNAARREFAQAALTQLLAVDVKSGRSVPRKSKAKGLAAIGSAAPELIKVMQADFTGDEATADTVPGSWLSTGGSAFVEFTAAVKAQAAAFASISESATGTRREFLFGTGNEGSDVRAAVRAVAGAEGKGASAATPAQQAYVLVLGLLALKGATLPTAQQAALSASLVTLSTHITRAGKHPAADQQSAIATVLSDLDAAGVKTLDSQLGALCSPAE